ncbi:MAG: hydrogenase 3 maturation endopeptidase HyCI [Thermoprotei archaeon]|nr:MAG: hydrogenase 3 maturation endopeptidase HyCI [Thermoprotei archaeon]
MMILCIGNPLRGDDAFGYLVYRRLREMGVSSALYAGSAPENVVGLIARARPSTLVIVDALVGGKGGELVITSLPEAKSPLPLTTHSIPLDILIRLAGLEPSQTVLIGAYASRLEFGAEPSEEVVKAAEKAALLLLRALSTDRA